MIIILAGEEAFIFFLVNQSAKHLITGATSQLSNQSAKHLITGATAFSFFLLSNQSAHFDCQLNKPASFFSNQSAKHFDWANKLCLLFTQDSGRGNI
jgi:hypothetical protein